MDKQSSSGEWTVVSNAKRTMALDREETGKKSHRRIAHDGLAVVAKYSVFLHIMDETSVDIMRETLDGFTGDCTKELTRVGHNVIMMINDLQLFRLMELLHGYVPDDDGDEWTTSKSKTYSLNHLQKKLKSE